MMKIYKTLSMCIGAAAFAWAGLSLADEDNHGRDFQAKLRLRAEYDDNIYDQGSDKQSSAKVDAEVELIYNMNFEHSYVGLRYRPTFVYWADRPSDDFDVHHEFNVDLNHAFSPRSTLAIKESFLYAELPELMDRGVAVQRKDTYIYNRANADYTYLVAPNTKAGVGGRYTLLRYEDDDVSENEDYDIYAAGLTLRHQLSVATTISGEARYESITYDGTDRDSDSIYVGALVEQMFGPDLIGSLRGGLQRKEFSADVDDANAPYVDGSITILSPSHRTRVTTGVGFSMYEADVYPYANQERLLMFISASHDLTARISLFVSGSYQNSSYNGDESVDQAATSGDGNEDVLQVSARGTYKINNSNWVEAGYQYLNLESDIRDDFDRNRVSVGWRTTL